MLVVGGTSTPSSGGALDTGEVYEPVTNTWTAVGDTMSSGRTSPIAVLLTNGKVLIAGGADASGVPVDTAELYDPVLNKFVAAASMHSERTEATGTRLSSGKVLVAGGLNAAGALVSSGEVYNPTSNSWTLVSNPMSTPRAIGSAVLLANGKAMIAGGASVNSPSVITTSAVDFYDQATNRFSAGPALGVAPGLFGLTSLADGRVLETGGEVATASTPPAVLTASEVYNPATNSWSTVGSLPGPEIALTATLLQNGQVLGAGGTGNVMSASVQAEVLTPTSKPGAAGAVSALAGNHSATVSFAPPASDGGLPVLRYTIRASTGQSVTTPDARPVTTVPGLANGRPVAFTVAAINALGAGAASAPSAAVIPGPPTLKLTGLKTKVKLKSFLKGISLKVAPNKAAALVVELVGSVHKATISAFNLTLARKSLSLSSARRTIKLVPSKKLVGHPRHAKVQLLIVATDSGGLRSTTTRTISVSR